MEVDMIKMCYICLWNFHKIKILINRYSQIYLRVKYYMWKITLPIGMERWIFNKYSNRMIARTPAHIQSIH